MDNKESVGEHTVRVGAWNVLADAYLRTDRYPHLHQDDLWGRSDMVIDRVVALAGDLDVLGLVECEEHVASGVVDALGDGWEASWVRRPGRRADGSCLLVRSLLLPSFDSHCSPVGDLAAARVKLAGVMEIAVTHFAWSPPGTAERPADRQIAALVETCAGAAAVCGDFNSLPGGQVEAAFARHGWTTTYPETPTAHFSHGAECIDGVATRGLVVTSLRTDGDSSMPLPQRGEPSDHLPILFDLEPGLVEATAG